jgi:hypothetical protein
MNAQQMTPLTVAHDPVIAEAMGLIIARMRALCRPGSLVPIGLAAKILNTDAATVRSWVVRGHLRYVVKPYLLRADVEAWRDRVPSKRGLNLQKQRVKPLPQS